MAGDHQGSGHVLVLGTRVAGCIFIAGYFRAFILVISALFCSLVFARPSFATILEESN